MSARNGSFDEASSSSSSSSWFTSIPRYLAPLLPCLGVRPRRSKSASSSTAAAAASSSSIVSWPVGRTSDQDVLMGRQDDEKSSVTLVSDPSMPLPSQRFRPAAAPEHGYRRPDSAGQRTRKSSQSARTSFSVRSLFNKSDASRRRRPLISGPSDFRHVNSSSFHFPSLTDEQNHFTPRRRAPNPARRSSFRPLELSIYVPNSQLSPMIPDFDLADVVSPPPRALVSDGSDDSHELLHQRSYSSKSFHIPRKNTASSSLMANHEYLPPPIPRKALGRARAYTSPEVETLKERVAGAMIEMERLQKQIDDVIERQSLYVISRPSSPQSMARTMPGWEPMPSIPALPPTAPSFAERLNPDVDRPRTAPIRSPVRIFNQSKEFNDTSSTFDNVNARVQDDEQLPPPLPLVLRPPLRKKKSFSRVSSWLFLSSGHSRETSQESVTNLPRPIKSTDGFYQCVPGANGIERRSFETLDHTVSTWETEDEDEEDGVPTAPTGLSPECTPVMKQGDSRLERTTTFGAAGRDSASGAECARMGM